MTIESAADLADWVQHAKPGSRVIYHRGFLMADRRLAPNALAIGSVADSAWNFRKSGAIDLVQHRDHCGQWVYAAIKKEKRN